MTQTPLETLGDERYVSLATFRRSGKAVETPVWVAEDGGRLYVFSAGEAGKVKRLRNDTRVRLAPCTARGRVTGDWHEGRGRLVAEPETCGRAYAALRRKYGWQMGLADVLSRLSGRYDQRAVIELEV